MEEYVTLEVHREFAKRMDEANERQSKRLSILEEKIQEVNRTSTAIERLSTKMEHMLEEQRKQGEKLSAIENRDGEMWRKVVGYIISAVVGGVIGYVFVRLGMG